MLGLGHKSNAQFIKLGNSCMCDTYIHITTVVAEFKRQVIDICKKI